MTPAVRLSIFLVLLSAIIVTGYHNSVKLRRDGVLNLYPFPRVGRASQRTWQVPLKDILYEYEPQEVKRQLYAFPRVGRDAPSHGSPQGEGAHDLQIQLHRSDSPGMWFGPRLGRGLRSEEDEISVPNYNNERSEPELMESDNNEARVRSNADQK